MPPPGNAKGTRVTPRDAQKIFGRSAGESHVFLLKRFRGFVLDIEDVHFHFDAAVLLPDFGDCGVVVDASDRNRITGLAVIRSIYRHLAAHPDQKMLIAGHTDREGRDDYNLKLSQLRADNVLHVLQGNRAAWVKVADQKHKVEDYKQILKWVDTIWDWGCDPGEVNNTRDAATKAAVKTFQQQYNRGAPHMPDGFQAVIAEDGDVGPQTWGAFFDVYMQVLRFIVEVDAAGLKSKQQAIAQRLLDPGKPAVGCGENHPLTANPVIDRRATKEERAEMRRLAQVDRRVEVLFFEPGEEPRLDCHPRAGQCLPDKCEIFSRSFFDLDPLDCEPIPRPVRTWVLRILKPRPTARVKKSGSDGTDEDVPPDQRVPLANKPFVATGVGGSAFQVEGTTDAEGVLRIEVVDDPVVITLRIAGLEITLDAGSLPPITAGDDAAKHRLRNLGYGAAQIGRWDDAMLKAGLTKFQRHHQISETGVFDSPTQAKLKEVHRS